MTDSCKTIWILNHYATAMFVSEGGRHYSLAKEFVRQGYSVKVFCASTIHNSDECIPMEGERHKKAVKDGVEFEFIRTRPYGGNGIQRILNMADFYRGVLLRAKQLPRPDVVIGSSVHPLAQNAALRIAKRFGCACIVETRDLWPASLEEYGIIKRGGLIARIMYANERRCYEKADAVVFTIEGGAHYLKDKGWDVGSGGAIDLRKVHCVNNGVDLEAYRRNLEYEVCSVPQLLKNGKAKLVYAGSIRKVNNLDVVVEVASCMRGDTSVEFIVLGDGDERETLIARAEELGLTNISFPGSVEKKCVPACLAKADILLLISESQEGLSRYGMSQNKLFDYLASGKPILSNLPSAYSIINEKGCGVERAFSDPTDMSEQIRQMLADKRSLTTWGDNARAAAALYSYESHARRYLEIVNRVVKEDK